ncbi:MAG TPA: hypothetical protein VNJ04_02520, partial [Gemmatimonadaceae bacterium]|nr:hypothetical protein [Gemmatimonadaceae bacterium]
EIFRACGFDAGAYNVDAARNLLSPAFSRCMLIPLNPRIPREAFDRLVTLLAARRSVARA